MCILFNIGHTTSSCTINIFLGKLFSGDDLIEYIEEKYAFKIIEYKQSCNVLRDDISLT